MAADQAMDMVEHSLMTEDEAMDMERSLMTFTIDDNGVAQSTGGSLISLYGQHNLEEEEEDEAAQFFDRASDDYGQDGDDDDDDVAYQFDFDDQEFGYPAEETVQDNDYYFDCVVILNLLAQQLDVDFETVLRLVFGSDDAGGDGILGAFVFPASDAAVAGLEKQAFHATAEGCGAITVCAICLDNFEDGEEVTVMPCSGRGHEFHPKCITKWLGKSNTCPLCRHALPTQKTS